MIARPLSRPAPVMPLDSANSPDPDGQPSGSDPELLADDAVDAWLAELGRRIARGRLRRDWSQAELARRAGVSLRTLVRLESGASTQLANWLQVLGALGWSAALLAALPDDGPSPLEQLESRGSGRRRSRAREPRQEASSWSWDLGAEQEPEATDHDRR